MEINLYTLLYFIIKVKYFEIFNMIKLSKL